MANVESLLSKRKVWLRLLMGLGLVAFLIVLYHYIFHVGFGEILTDTAKLKVYIEGLGFWGPFAIVLFMTIAVVMSPIPSAPIAVASGALFGHSWGTLYVLVGAEIGAIIAFTVSKLAGYELLKSWFGDKLNIGILKSQKNMTFIIFISRLIPFVSFDIISYAAGLTPISFVRFATATFFGILPISFLLAHFGSDLGSSDPQRVMTTIFFLGFITAIPIVIAKWLKREKISGKG